MSASLSTIVASPSRVAADVRATSTLTVTLKDTGGAPVAGKTVTLSAGGGSSTIVSVSGTTNVSGVATFTATDAIPEQVVYSARDATDRIDVGSTAAVTFTAAVTTTTTITTTTTTTTTPSASASPPPGSVPVTGTPAPTAVFTFAPSSPVVGEAVAFDTSSSATANDFEWSFGDASTGAGITTTHLFTAPGTYTVTLRAVGAGGTVMTMSTITVGGRPPVPSFEFTVHGAEVLFNASASQRGSYPIASYRWVFGDRTGGTGVHAADNYPTVRSYLVTLIVTDARDFTARVTRMVAIPKSVAVSVTEGVGAADAPASTPGVEVSINESPSVSDTVTVVRYRPPRPPPQVRTGDRMKTKVPAVLGRLRRPWSSPPRSPRPPPPEHALRPPR